MTRASWWVMGALAALASMPSAQAVEVARNDVQGASGMCKAATAAYAANARYRPLGLANESDSSIFVTCNWQGDDNGDSGRGATRVYVVITNNGSTSRSFTCTLVEGHQDGALTFATQTPRTVSIAAGAGATLQWVPTDLAGDPETIELPSLSCLLPANSTLQYTGKEYNEDVGS